MRKKPPRGNITITLPRNVKMHRIPVLPHEELAKFLAAIPTERLVFNKDRTIVGYHTEEEHAILTELFARARAKREKRASRVRRFWPLLWPRR